MNTFLEQAELAREDKFRVRVMQALVKVAVAIGAENLPDSRRANYATQVLNNPDHYAPKFSFAVACVAEKDSEDELIEYVILSAFNAFAGAYDKREPQPPAAEAVLAAIEAEKAKVEPVEEKKSLLQKIFGG